MNTLCVAIFRVFGGGRASPVASHQAVGKHCEKGRNGQHDHCGDGSRLQRVGLIAQAAQVGGEAGDEQRYDEGDTADDPRPSSRLPAFVFAPFERQHDALNGKYCSQQNDDHPGRACHGGAAGDEHGEHQQPLGCGEVAALSDPCVKTLVAEVVMLQGGGLVAHHGTQVEQRGCQQ